MRKALSVFVAGAALLISISCGNNPRASLRIVHAAPGAPGAPNTPPTAPIDVTIDGNKVLSNVAYSTGSNYFSVTPGSRHFQMNVTGDKTFFVDTTINLTDKTYTTMTLVGEFGMVPFPNPIPPAISIATSTDDHSVPAAGQVKIRVMQAAVGYDLPVPPPPPPQPNLIPAPVDVYITAFGTLLNGNPPTPTLPNVSYQSTTAYVSKAVGDLQVRVVAPAGCGITINPCNPDNNIIIDSGKVTFTDKKQLQTYVLTDQAPPSAQFQGFFLHDLN
jgi:hypothetical protein